MGPTPKSKTSQLPKLLIKLNRDQLTGMVTIKDNKRSLRVYLRQGHIVSADGLDVESRLIKEIVAKKGLSPGEGNELGRIREKDPGSLGRTLVDRGFVSPAVWSRFLLLRVKQTLGAAFQMTDAELGFSESPVKTPLSETIDYNFFQLLMETVKGVREEAVFRSHVAGPEGVYETSPDTDWMKGKIPLTPSEEVVLNLIDGRRTVGDLISAGVLGESDVYRTLYLLLFFGMIQPGGAGADEEGVNLEEIARLYLDLLSIIEANFRKEVGKQFDKIYRDSLKELGPASGALFESMDLSRDAQDDMARRAASRCPGGTGHGEGLLFLKGSFNKLIFLLIMRMKKVLGVGLTEKTILEMMNILDYVEKYRQNTEMMNYVKGNLEDYLRQVKA